MRKKMRKEKGDPDVQTQYSDCFAPDRHATYNFKLNLYLNPMAFKTLIIAFFLLGTISQSFSQREFKTNEGDTTYVMKRYVFMLLNQGPNRDQDSATIVKIQEGHMNHINEMAKTGKMFMAGPFETGGKHRGILVFDVDSISEALKMESTDPAILSGRLEMQAIYWWAAKGTKLP